MSDVMWWVRRNGEVSGPYTTFTVADMVRRGWWDIALRIDGDANIWTPVTQTEFARLLPAPPPPSNTGRNVALVIALGCVTLAGCGFIAVEPVIALAIFFVGIPFVLGMIWLAFVVLSRANQR